MTSEEVERPRADETRTWLRIAAGCAVLVGLAFIQAPGLMVPDTKFDLVADPTGFLERALHLWDEQGAFGQLQNQAYGYLWPMGPFFVLGELLDLPGWVTQRLWMALVMCVAFVGTARTSRAMGVRSDVACLVAATAYATSPRILSTIGPISIEAWPSAVAPWVLLALVKGSQTGSPRRMALFAGLAVATVGGVNATATFAVIPLGMVWLLTRTPGPRRRSLMLWWPVFTVLGTLWWLVPLFVMGAYSPPFLDYIESASVTTFPTTLFDALRGTSAWVPYVDPSWQGGRTVLTRPYLALNSGIVLMLGLVGMLWSGNRHRQFLVISTGVGLFLVTLGHVGAVQGWFAADLHRALDGVLAPLRNVHKFDPIIRLPMVLGLAWLIEAVTTSRERASVEVGSRTIRWPAHLPVTGLALLAVLGATLPLASGRVAPENGVQETPPYWRQAVAWLDDQEPRSVALLVPGSSFAEYLWGTPRDEPVQYLDAERWAVRNAIPLTPGANIRMLDAVENRLNQGRASPGLADYLRRAGVGHVVVRNDLKPDGDVPSPVLVHEALSRSPGLRPVASFGPDVGGGAHLETDQGRLLVDGGWQATRPAIEIYEVAGHSQRAVTGNELPVVAGGPEDLLDLADVGVLGSSPTELAADRGADGAPPEAWVLTDGLLDRERFFGRVHDASSAVRTPATPRRSGNPVPDYLLGHDRRWRTTARLEGARALRASSSRSDSTAFGGAVPGEQPIAATDGDPDTEWVSDAAQEGTAWWRIDLEDATSVDEVTLTLGDGADERTTVRVVTEDGAGSPVDLVRGQPQTVPVGATTTWLRVEHASRTGGQMALAEVRIPGVTVTKRLVLPEVPGQWGNPDTILLRGLLDTRTGCARVAGDVRCLAGRAMASEEPAGFRREVRLPEPMTAHPTLTARPRAGGDLARLIQRDQPLNARGSTVGVPDPRASGIAAVDGDPGTAWTSRVDDLRPALSLNWIGRHRLDRIALTVEDDSPVRRPTTVELVWPGGKRRVELGEDGRARFRPIRTDRLTIQVVEAGNAASIDSSGVGAKLPVGIGEVRLRGLPLAPLRIPTTPQRYECGTGPTLSVNGDLTRTRLVARPTDLYAMRPVAVRPCGGRDRVRLHAGANTVDVAASPTTTPASLLLDTDGTAALGATSGPATTADADASSMTLRPDPDSEVVVVHQNANPGWEAHQAGEELEPVVVDGWQQGWRTNGSGAPVKASFTPDTPYRVGLAVGLLCLLGLVCLLLVPRRRWPGATHPSLAARGSSGALLLPAGVAAAGVLGGWPGVGCAVVGVAAGYVVRRLGDAGTWLLGALWFVASGAYFVRPWGDASGWAGAWAWPHYLVLVALTGAVVVVADGFRPRFRSRIAGRSTTR